MIRRFGLISAKDSLSNKVHSKRKQTIMMTKVMIFLFIRYSPSPDASSPPTISCLVVVMTSTSCRLLKSTAGVI